MLWDQSNSFQSIRIMHFIITFVLFNFRRIELTWYRFGCRFVRVRVIEGGGENQLKNAARLDTIHSVHKKISLLSLSFSYQTTSSCLFLFWSFAFTLSLSLSHFLTATFYVWSICNFFHLPLSPSHFFSLLLSLSLYFRISFLKMFPLKLSSTYLCSSLSLSFIKWANPGLFLFIFVIFSIQFQYKLKKA